MDGRERLRGRFAEIADDLRITADMVVTALERNRRAQLGIVVALAIVAAYVITNVPGSASSVTFLSATA